MPSPSPEADRPPTGAIHFSRRLAGWLAATHRAPLGLDPGLLLVLIVFTLASAVAINPYYFGDGDNAITIPLLKASIDPGLYPGDFFVAQRPYYYTYLWNTLGLLHARLGIGLPALFLATYLLALFATFLAMARLARTLFERREVVILALLFLLFSKETLATVDTVEATLITRQVATPLLLFALDEFLKRNTVRSFLLLGLAYLVHPLTTHFVLAMLLVSGIVEVRRRGWRPLAIGVGVFFAVASPVLAWRLRHSPPALHLFAADPQWLIALHQRSSHHVFASTWGWAAALRALVTAVLFGIGWRHRDRDREDRHRVMVIAAVTTVALCAFGVVGSELHPMGAALISQPLRAYQFMEYFAMLYIAHDLVRRLAGAERILQVAGAVAIAGGILWGYEHLVVALLVLALVAGRIAWPRLTRRPEPGRATLAATATAAAVIAAVACVPLDIDSGSTTFSPVDQPAPAMRDVQQWARGHTDVRDAFIVPPGHPQQFRMNAERTVYATWEDGGLGNFDPAYAREWLRRMRMLGFAGDGPAPPDFCALKPGQARRIARELKPANRRVYLVWPCGERPLPFPRAYRNDQFAVYAVD